MLLREALDNHLGFKKVRIFQILLINKLFFKPTIKVIRFLEKNLKKNFILQYANVNK